MQVAINVLAKNPINDLSIFVHHYPHEVFRDRSKPSGSSAIRTVARKQGSGKMGATDEGNLSGGFQWNETAPWN
jgi:hypothetical protein